MPAYRPRTAAKGVLPVSLHLHQLDSIQGRKHLSGSVVNSRSPSQITGVMVADFYLAGIFAFQFAFIESVG